MKSRLGLTEDQEARIRPILEDEFVKRHTIIEKYQGQGRQGRSSLKNELQQLRSSTDHQLEPILTKAQTEEYRKMQEEARQRIRGGGHGSRAILIWRSLAHDFAVVEECVDASPIFFTEKR